MNNKIEQTYIFGGKDDKCYMVSTINRTSSTPIPMRYAETLVWEWDSETRERGHIIDQDEAGTGTRSGHDRMVIKYRY